MTPEEAYRSLQRGSSHVGVNPRPRYAGVYLGLYGEEDVWDQALCVGAHDAGYDIVVLESMVGRHHVVSEEQVDRLVQKIASLACCTLLIRPTKANSLSVG